LANVSYEFLAPSASEDEPTRVLFLCRFHGNVGLCDGSVQQIDPAKLSEALVQRDGKLYFERLAPAPANAQAPLPAGGEAPNENP